jgi:subtilisin family serine protease
MIVAFLLVSCAGAARPKGTESYQGREVAANEVLVKFRGAPPQAISQAVTGENVDETEAVGSIQAVRFHSRSKNVDTLIHELSARSDVEYVEPNYVVHAVATPDDPSFASLWGMQSISAPQAWDMTTGRSPGPMVAVVDTGIDYTHADLTGNVWSAPADFKVTINGVEIPCLKGTHGFNAITHTCDPMDDAGHGTHVSGTIGAVGNNGIGVAGENWNARIMGAKFLNSGGSGYLSDAIEAIDFVIQAKQAFGDQADVRALSNSWGGGGFSQALLDEINLANANGMLFVAAAGNSGWDLDTTPSYPASYGAPNVVAVAAIDSAGNLASWSNYGRSSVDLAAPGVNILSTVPGGYQYMSGTSMATPHVSGAAALILSVCNLDTAQLKDDILSTVDQIPSLNGKTVTGGRLNVYTAIQACSGPARAPTTTTLGASPDSSTYGDPVTFTATVTPSDGVETPTGVVTFLDGSFALGTRTLSGGQATFTTAVLWSGVHSIAATYGGDSSFGGSTSPALSFTVGQVETTTTLTSSAATSTFAEPVTFTAAVSPAAATGPVTFFDGETVLGTVNLSSGSASLPLSTLTAGTHSVTAMYYGSNNHQASESGAVPVTVNQATSMTSLASSPNPSIFGQSVTLTATVSPSAATGTVTFYDGTGQLGTGTLSGGRAAFSTSGLTTGDHTITATYGGDANVIGGTSPVITQKVTSTPPADFTISVSPSSRTVTRGSSTTYTITISRISGFSNTVSLSISGLPSGATGTFIPSSITGSRTSSTLTVRTRTNTPTGTSTLTITGSSNGITHQAIVTLVVNRRSF